MDEILRLENIVVEKAGKHILKIGEMRIRKGGRVAIIGPNGAGKSTLLRVLGLMEKPAAGDVYFKNEKVGYGANILSFRRRMAAVFQRPLLLDTTVYNNAGIGLRFRGVSRSEIHERVKRWLSALGIWERRDQAAKTLSGGEAQRLSIARALCTDPEIMLFDEPFAALDAPTREKLIKEFKDILDSTRITSIMVTHDFSELPFLSDITAVIFDGELVQYGPTREVLDRPVTEEIARFVGMENILEGMVQAGGECPRVNIAGRVLTAGTREKFPAGSKVKVCVRPEKVKLNAGPDGNRLDGVIEEVIDKGSYIKVRINCGFRITALTLESRTAGEKVEVSILPRDIHMVPGTNLLTYEKI